MAVKAVEGFQIGRPLLHAELNRQVEGVPRGTIDASLDWWPISVGAVPRWTWKAWLPSYSSVTQGVATSPLAHIHSRPGAQINRGTTRTARLRRVIARPRSPRQWYKVHQTRECHRVFAC